MSQNISKLIRKFFSEDWLCLTAILSLSIIAVSPLFLMGIPEGNKDLPQHLQFAAAYYDAFFSGDFLPVWASSDNYGFGSVGVRFYPPISSFSLVLLKILTGNWFDAIWTSFLFWMFTGCLGIYFWARE